MQWCRRASTRNIDLLAPVGPVEALRRCDVTIAPETGETHDAVGAGVELVGGVEIEGYASFHDVAGHARDTGATDRSGDRTDVGVACGKFATAWESSVEGVAEGSVTRNCGIKAIERRVLTATLVMRASVAHKARVDTPGQLMVVNPDATLVEVGETRGRTAGAVIRGVEEELETVIAPVGASSFRVPDAVVGANLENVEGRAVVREVQCARHVAAVGGIVDEASRRARAVEVADLGFVENDVIAFFCRWILPSREVRQCQVVGVACQVPVGRVAINRDGSSRNFVDIEVPANPC